MLELGDGVVMPQYGMPTVTGGLAKVAMLRTRLLRVSAMYSVPDGDIINDAGLLKVVKRGGAPSKSPTFPFPTTVVIVRFVVQNA